ncbi:MAG: FAD-dependent monooxygenase [Gammaproteobacteria bacterium]|nr:FAD-dependent monooxygenase [Gammaproteobacteria bacterium]
MTDAQVIIVGAGPVGTVAAYYLAQKGIRVQILEAAASCEEDMRASTIHSPTLEMLDELGITDLLIGEGLKAPTYQYRIRATHEILEFDLNELASELKFPFRLQCEQYKLARLLANALQDHPAAEIRFRHRVVSFEQRFDGVIVSSESPDGIRQFRANFLIAADGASSIVRKQLGVEFSGFTYPEKFLTLSTRVEIDDYFRSLCYVNYVSDPQEWYVLLRVPSSWRVLVPVQQDQSDEYILSDEKKNKVFDGLMGDGKSVTTHHRTIYRVHQRVATKFNHGCVVLVGDAAHLNNPLGGFGMNGGIHDAWNLVQKLTRIIQGNENPTELLDHYDRQRRTIMNEFVQAQTIRNKRMIEEGEESSQQLEWDEMRNIHSNDELRRKFMLRQSMVQSVKDEIEIE